MGIFVKLVFCVVMIVTDTCNARALDKRMQITENRIRTLELKTDLNTDDILQNSERITDLNDTVLEMKNRNNGDQKQDKQSNVLTPYTHENSIYDDMVIERVIDAHKNEKVYIRKHVEYVEEQFMAFKLEMTKEVEANIQAFNNTAEKVKAGFADFQGDVKSALDLFDMTHMDEIRALHKTDVQMIEEINELKTEVVAAYVVSSLVHTNEKNTTEINELKKRIRQLEELIATFKSVCPNNWTVYNKAFYRYFNIPSTKYDDAKKLCSPYNAHLVDIQNEEEMFFVLDLVGHGIKFWLGLTDRDTEGTWFWGDHGVKASYQNWRPGQPDGNGDQNCAFAGYESPYDQWNDIGCNTPSDTVYEKYTVCKIVPK